MCMASMINGFTEHFPKAVEAKKVYLLDILFR